MMNKDTKKQIYDSVMDALQDIVEKAMVNETLYGSPDDMEEPFQMVQSDYFDEEKHMWAIDAWHDPDAEDDGYVAAYVDPRTYEVMYMTEEAEESKLVDEEIQTLIKHLKEEKRKKM